MDDTGEFASLMNYVHAPTAYENRDRGRVCPGDYGPLQSAHQDRGCRPSARRHLAGQPMTREQALRMRGAHAIDEPPADTAPRDVA